MQCITSLKGSPWNLVTHFIRAHLHSLYFQKRKKKTLTLFPFYLPAIVTRGMVPGTSKGYETQPYAHAAENHCSLLTTSGRATRFHPRGRGDARTCLPSHKTGCVCVCWWQCAMMWCVYSIRVGTRHEDRLPARLVVAPNLMHMWV